jgi:hypothetical protein
LEGVCAYYQQSLDRDLVLATYEPELANAIDKFRLRIPRFVDLAFDFQATRAGFNGIIVEAKSGAQQYDDTVPQFRAYSTAHRRLQGSRYLTWGIVEKGPDRTDVPVEDLQRMFAAANKKADVWVFSSADDIPVVLRAALGIGAGNPGTSHDLNGEGTCRREWRLAASPRASDPILAVTWPDRPQIGQVDESPRRFRNRVVELLLGEL